MPRLELVETSLRAGQQALLVSRLRRRHALAAATALDGCGFAALDVFGGATFEAQLRFLGENPFERLRDLRAALPSTSLLATIGGQALAGHRHAADDVVDAFITRAAAAGIDVFRCYDPLNDVRNLERPLAAVHGAARSAEGVIVYRAAGGDAAARTAAMAAALAERGFDSLCLYDPLGALGVAQAGELVTAIRNATPLPLTVSFAAQTGQADFAYAAAVDSGAARLDVALSPLAGGASHPAAEAVIAAFAGTAHDTGMDLGRVAAAAATLDHALAHYADIVDTSALRLDTSALRGLLPPSAMGAALAELRRRDAVDRIDEVEAEVARIRTELGTPPLVTPLTEIIATQAVYNVCDGDRYATISQEVKDYCLGLYGQPPQAIDADVRRIVNGREEPITLRPADLLDPALDASRQDLVRQDLPTDPDAVVTNALFPVEWQALARGEVVAEPLGDDPAPPPAPAEPAPAEEAVAEPAPAAPPDEVRDLTVEVDGQSYSVRVIGAAGSFGGGGAATAVAAAPAGTSAKPAVREGTVTAPMQGLILKVPVKVGDKVALGDVVAVLEAMKMQNDIAATRAGTVTEIYVKEGSVVSPRDPVVLIG